MNSKAVILCVDDTPGNLEVLVELLHEYEPVVSLDPFNALSLLERIDVDMILLDVMMPGMDGFELCRRIKSDPKFETVPLLFLTAKSDDASMEAGYEAGGVDYITKPFRPKELLSRVRTHLNLHALVNDLGAQVAKAVETQRRQENLLITQSYAATMGRMIDIVAHQWMQPLNNVNMRLGKLMLDYDDEMVDREYLETLQQRSLFQIRHLVKTLNEFRSFMSPEKTVERFSLRTMIDKALLLFRENMTASRIRVDYADTNDMMLTAIENEFIHVVMNLLENSKEAFEQQGVEACLITISIDPTRRTLQICDNAGGIDPNDMERIFELHVSGKKESGGSGIGLYMVKMIADKYGVVIDVANKNGGACFTFVMPA